MYAISSQNAGHDEFPSRTYIHIFDQQGGTLLQFIEFHTSCSQPLSEGDQFGANLLEGILFKNGVVCGDPGDIPTPPVDCCDLGGKPTIIALTYLGTDCSTTITSQDPGKVECIGNPAGDLEVYIISNDNSNPHDGKIWFSGTVPLFNVYVLHASNAGSDNFGSTTYIHIFDEENGNLLQFVKFHTSCSQPINEGDQYGANAIEGILFDNGEICGTDKHLDPNDAPPPADCCDIGDKPNAVTFKYTGKDCSATTSDQDPDKVQCSGDPALDSEVYIISNSDVNATSGDIWFNGSVLLGEEFTITSANAGKDNFGSRTYLHIYDAQGGSLLQFIEFHTSCSQPLSTNDVYGSLELNSINFNDGSICSDGNSNFSIPNESVNAIIGNEILEFSHNQNLTDDVALISIFPNPFHSEINIKAVEEIQLVNVYSLQGVLLASYENNSNKMRIDMSSFVNGMYYIEVNSGLNREIRKMIRLNN